jgi:5-methylcytosine-specific restriction endonuclease McrA
LTNLIAEESEQERIEADRHQRPPRAELVLALIERDGDECRYCHRDFSVRERTIDHVYPQSRAYADGWSYDQVWSLDNLALACKPCNAKKSDLILNDDGTIPKRRERTFRYRRDKRAQRAEICTSCNAGRNLGPDEVCASCNSGPQPERWPRWAKVKSADCDHELFWCWACGSGVVDRTPASEMILIKGEGQEEGYFG